ncbi:unnamed protein product [Calicophoron daubneyi]|uniref:Uncharacterized protein n=1 Tax=Calicophoron daubneyi TaxID=300641 RepID=A0AAV2TEM5_CALDB
MHHLKNAPLDYVARKTDIERLLGIMPSVTKAAELRRVKQETWSKAEPWNPTLFAQNERKLLSLLVEHTNARPSRRYTHQLRRFVICEESEPNARHSG